jgi:hypothetical protein
MPETVRFPVYSYRARLSKGASADVPTFTPADAAPPIGYVEAPPGAHLRARSGTGTKALHVPLGARGERSVVLLPSEAVAAAARGDYGLRWEDFR